MPSVNKLSSYRTTITARNGNTCITYVSTVIVEFDAECVILRTGGYKSVTTKRKMNQTSNQFNLPYSVFQKAGDWYVSTSAGTFPFTGSEFVLDRSTLSPLKAAA